MPFLSHFKDVHAPLQAIHANLVGPISPPTNAGARYFLTIVDQYSGHIHVNILVNKSNALEAITKYKAAIENQTNLTIKKLISDGGGEFVSGALSKILASVGIKHIISPPYTPQHNGYAERANQTVIEMTRTMMMQANLAPEWWGEEVRTAAATTNCLPLLGKTKATPLELMFKVKPKMNFFRPFGCKV
jgi:transposase InsO family protein